MAQPSGPALHHLLAAGDVGLLWGATAHDGRVPFRLISDEVRMGHQYVITWPVTTAKQVALESVYLPSSSRVQNRDF